MAGQRSSKKRREEKQKKSIILSSSSSVFRFIWAFSSSFSSRPSAGRRGKHRVKAPQLLFLSLSRSHSDQQLYVGKRYPSIPFGIREQFSRLHMAKDVRPLSSVRFHCIHFFPKRLLPDGASELPNHLCAYLMRHLFVSMHTLALIIKYWGLLLEKSLFLFSPLRSPLRSLSLLLNLPLIRRLAVVIVLTGVSSSFESLLGLLRLSPGTGRRPRR